MNYVRHLNAFFELVAVDDRLTPCHISTYMSLFQLWNKSHFPNKLSVCRSEVMEISKIGSTHTYYKCIKQLHEYGYLIYYPSNNPIRGSVVTLHDLGDSDPLEESEEGDKEEETGKNEAENSNVFSRKTSDRTQVRQEQNRHKSSSKSASSRAHVVLPFINNINRINNKQRERRARDFFYKDLIFEKGKVERQAFKPPTKISMKALLESARKKELPGGGTETQVPETKVLLVKEKKSRPEIIQQQPKPTLAEIQSYFRSSEVNGISGKGISLPDQEALKFFHHYEANGWLVGGRTPMHNWKAACHSWAMKIPAFTRHQQKMTYDPATGITPRNQGLHVVLKKSYAQAL